MRLELTQSATADLDAIANYIAQDNPAAAGQVFRTIVAATHRLTDVPEMGRVGRLPDTREITVAGLPYLVVYQVAGDVITVVAVFHEARDLVHALVDRQKGMKK